MTRLDRQTARLLKDYNVWLDDCHCECPRCIQLSFAVQDVLDTLHVEQGLPTNEAKFGVRRTAPGESKERE